MSTTTMGIMGTLQLICIVWVIYEVWGVNKSLTSVAKILWTLAVFIFGIFGAAAYYFIEKNRKSIDRQDSYI